MVPFDKDNLYVDKLLECREENLRTFHIDFDLDEIIEDIVKTSNVSAFWTEDDDDLLLKDMQDLLRELNTRHAFMRERYFDDLVAPMGDDFADTEELIYAQCQFTDSPLIFDLEENYNFGPYSTFIVLITIFLVLTITGSMPIWLSYMYCCFESIHYDPFEENDEFSEDEILQDACTDYFTQMYYTIEHYKRVGGMKNFEPDIFSDVDYIHLSHHWFYNYDNANFIENSAKFCLLSKNHPISTFNKACTFTLYNVRKLEPFYQFRPCNPFDKTLASIYSFMDYPNEELKRRFEQHAFVSWNFQLDCLDYSTYYKEIYYYYLFHKTLPKSTDLNVLPPFILTNVCYGLPNNSIFETFRPLNYPLEFLISRPF